jgi:hypothetical protein
MTKRLILVAAENAHFAPLRLGGLALKNSFMGIGI